jgi:general secretion pathway protein B
MSYILDALRKADAERERGAVPGIHDQAMFNGVPQFGARRGIRPWVMWLIAAVMLVLILAVAALVWKMRGPAPRAYGEPTTASRNSPALPTIPVTPTPTTSVPDAPASPPAESATARAPAGPGTTVAAAPSSAARAEPAKPAPVRKSKPVVPAKGADTAVAAQSLPAARPPQGTESNANMFPSAALPNTSPTTAASPGASPATSPAVSVARIYTMGELPDDIRRQVPTVTVGGSMYSSTPANRILIINGTVFHEGDKLAPDLVLQQIRLKAAVLSFKDYRYLLNF